MYTGGNYNTSEFCNTFPLLFLVNIYFNKVMKPYFNKKYWINDVM